MTSPPHGTETMRMNYLEPINAMAIAEASRPRTLHEQIIAEASRPRSAMEQALAELSRPRSMHERAISAAAKPPSIRERYFAEIARDRERFAGRNELARITREHVTRFGPPRAAAERFALADAAERAANPIAASIFRELLSVEPAANAGNHNTEEQKID